jgi:hypothetical protein
MNRDRSFENHIVLSSVGDLVESPEGDEIIITKIDLQKAETPQGEILFDSVPTISRPSGLIIAIVHSRIISSRWGFEIEIPERDDIIIAKIDYNMTKKPRRVKFYSAQFL